MFRNIPGDVHQCCEQPDMKNSLKHSNTFLSDSTFCSIKGRLQSFSLKEKDHLKKKEKEEKRTAPKH